MMMPMGGAILVMVVIPLVAIGMLLIARVTGSSPRLIEQLLPPGLFAGGDKSPVLRAENQAEPQAHYEPLGTHSSSDAAGELERYKRYCQTCGIVLQRGWKHCPECGQALHWV